ncbi:hypothetical protein [Actinoplanes couchii]|uniref:Uncharacterized protein n=1 Tax=Actinoplanes couchii TaxID=403638 RepID=A0ABQ3XCT3_9ACTN|nr:hypothetical protein [Actinoplanes couchii]MDR6321203.1 hypothetical protein [Actinoplanes couchii]GID56312.1 hypothetical protein Aco03nite_047160 [Actinoplanes couchii]
MWGATGETSDNLWDLAQGLDAALSRFVHEDDVAAAEMFKARDVMQGDRTGVNDEWSAGHDDGTYPR